MRSTYMQTSWFVLFILYLYIFHCIIHHVHTRTYTYMYVRARRYGTVRTHQLAAMLFLSGVCRQREKERKGWAIIRYTALSFIHSLTHTHTHTYTYTYTYTHIYIYIYIYIYICIHTHTHARSLTPSLTHFHCFSHAHILPHLLPRLNKYFTWQVKDFVSRFMPAYDAYVPRLYTVGPQKKESAPVLKITVDINRFPISSQLM